MSKLAALTLFVVALSLVGCSVIPPNTTSSPKPTTYVGEDAAAIAGQIKGCSEVKAGDVGAGAPVLVSTATCTLSGHLVNVNSWENASYTDLGIVLTADAKEAYYATGKGWTAALGDDPTLQMQFENDAAGLLSNAFNDPTPKSANLDAQKTMATTVANSLGGEVKHFVP